MKCSRFVCRVVFTVLLLSFIAIVSGCENRKSVKIGFVGGLSGKFSDTGYTARDGALLAVEEINGRGGLNGRPVKMIFKDDRQNVETLHTALEELHAEGIRLVIGPLLSQMAVEAVNATKDHRMIFVSPTVSTPQLSGLDDNFFRIYPHSDQLVDKLAHYLINQTSLRQVCIVADTSNAAFTLPSLERFKSTFTAIGGTVLGYQTFQTATDSDFLMIPEKLKSIGCEGVVAFASAMDLALMCQQFAKAGLRQPVFTTEWAYSDDLIQLGGKTVENVSLVHTFSKDGQTEGGRSFARRFMEKFGYAPNFSALHSFDATRLALTALQDGSPDDNPAHALKRLNDFQGMQSRISFDQYGDVVRDVFLSKIVDGRFEHKQTL